MLGWMLIFTAMLFLGGIVAVMDGGIGPALGLTLSLVFGFLLLVSALTMVLRGHSAKNGNQMR